MKVSSLWLKDWSGSAAHDDACSEISALSITPAPSTASLCPEESSLTLSGYACDTSTAASSPNPILKAGEQEEVNTTDYKNEIDNPVFEVNADENAQGMVVGEVNEDNEAAEEEEEEREDQGTAEDFEISAAFKTPGFSGRQTSNASSAGLGRSSSGVSTGSSDGSFSALQRRCRRLARERDEARAESFAEASVAVQRGIEIENLKRAKDMLLQRLETTEMQLMMAMRMDLQGSPSVSKTNSRNTESAGGVVDETSGKERVEEEEISSGETHSPAAATVATTTKKKHKEVVATPAAAPYGDSEAVVLALVDAKVSLATKEFEIMELQGQLRAKEAHVEALSQHLAAVRVAAEERAVALASTPTTGGGRSMRSVWHTPSITPPWSSSPKNAENIVANAAISSSKRASPLGTAVNTMFSNMSGNTTPTAAQAAAASGTKHTSAPVVHIVAHAEAAEAM